MHPGWQVVQGRSTISLRLEIPTAMIVPMIASANNTGNHIRFPGFSSRMTASIVMTFPISSRATAAEEEAASFVAASPCTARRP